MIRIVPAVDGTALTAVYTCLAEGLAKVSPLTDAERKPRPTKPVEPGLSGC